MRESSRTRATSRAIRLVEEPAEKGGTPRPLIRVFLNYGPHGEKVISGIERISRPGRRVYLGVDDVPAVLGGLGTNILTTSRGRDDRTRGAEGRRRRRSAL